MIEFDHVYINYNTFNVKPLSAKLKIKVESFTNLTIMWENILLN